MKESESLNAYSSKLTDIVNQMKTLGENMPNQKVVEKILISLPEKFDPIVTTIEQFKDISTMSVQELLGSLKIHEKRFIRHNEKFIESASFSV